MVEHKKILINMIDRDRFRLRPRNEKNVRCLEESILSGSSLPSPIVVKEDEKYFCLDGDHRLEAMSRQGDDMAWVRVLPFKSEEEHLKHAIQANVERGKSLTLGEKKELALKLFESNSASFKNKEVARLLSVSKNTIKTWIDQKRGGQIDPQLKLAEQAVTTEASSEPYTTKASSHGIHAKIVHKNWLYDQFPESNPNSGHAIVVALEFDEGTEHEKLANSFRGEIQKLISASIGRKERT